ncbi:MAG: L,D-transpeptidase [Cohaesibacteraceae bacterium]
MRRRIVTTASSGKGHRQKVAHVRRAAQGPGSQHLGKLILADRVLTCALGRSGISGLKREGDGATPRGGLRLLSGRFRADRVHRPSSRWRGINASDGWCDAPFTPRYNQQVRLPWPVSHETLTRDDHLYDRLSVLDGNISRRSQARGSAIFLHQARIENGQMKPTEGCVALKVDDFRRLASHLSGLKVIRVL